MECGWVSDPHPNNDTHRGSDGEVRLAPPFAYKTFEKLFPYYLSIGMTYDQYWRDDCDLVVAYREAHRLRVKERNQEMWAQGMYICHAVGAAMSPKAQYPKEPFELDFTTGEKHEERKRQEQEKKQMQPIKDYMQSFAAQFNKRRKDDHNAEQ